MKERFQWFNFSAYIYWQTFVVMALIWYLSRGAYEDDAYISLRYAKHLLEGHGLTWNPGERVEGYTNFLFILLTAALGRVGVNLVLASQIVSFAAFGILLIIFAHHVGILSKKQRLANTYPLASALTFSAVASSISLLVWCYEGMEPVVFTCFITGAVCAVIKILQNPNGVRDGMIIGVLFALATLTRLDGLVFSATTFIFFAALYFVPSGQRVSISCIITMVGSLAAIIIPYMCWRHAYFGDWLPNTYYAKLYGIDPALKWKLGLEYLFLFFCLPPLLPLFAIGLLILTCLKRKLTVSIAYLAILSAVFLLYIASTGGDNMVLFRFMTPVIPVLALLIYHCGIAIYSLRNDKIFRDIAGGLVFFLALQLGLCGGPADRPSLGALSGLAVSDYIRDHWPHGSLIALNPVGALPYTVDDNRYIDMLGLTDAHIAHRAVAGLPMQGPPFMGHLKGDGAYILSRKPDYIIFNEAWGDLGPLYLSDLELAASPEFAKHYKKVEVYIDPPAYLLPSLQSLALPAPSTENSFPVLNDKNQLRFIYYQRIR